MLKLNSRSISSTASRGQAVPFAPHVGTSASITAVSQRLTVPPGPAVAPRLHQCSTRGASSSNVACRVLTESRLVDLTIGMPAPEFSLPEPLTGKTVSLSDLKGSPVLIMFICNHCPFVVHLKDSMREVCKEYQAKGVKVVAISSNSIITHPQDGPEKMAEDAKQYGYTFPYLYDETQEVAKAYTAACTPEFYVFDAKHKLAYHGQWDDSRPRGPAANIPITAKDIRAALDAVLDGKPVPQSRPSIGCNIKWAPNNEPSYFGLQVVNK